jgi:choline dehydrogenase-like flavoprotein
VDSKPSLAQLQKPEESHFDVLIIGSGAGGGTLARGDWLPQEPQNSDADAVFQKGRSLSMDTWFDGAGKPYQPGTHDFRLRQRDFEPWYQKAEAMAANAHGFLLRPHGECGGGGARWREAALFGRHRDGELWRRQQRPAAAAFCQ